MCRSICFLKVVFCLCAIIVAVGAFNSSTTTSTTRSYNYTSGYSNSSSRTTTTTSSQIDTFTYPPSPQDTVTHILPQSISEVIFPTAVPLRPIRPQNIRSGRWGLPQARTNGRSLLGTLPQGGRGGAPRFPRFLGLPGYGGGVYAGSNNCNSHDCNGDRGNGETTNPGPQFAGGQGGGPRTFPWGSRTATNTDPYNDPPKTGVVRKYNFVIERSVMAPDGVERDVIVINGQFPGPTIEANWGDTIEVTVVNAITGPREGTSLHWHGLLQKGTPYEDGVPGVTQCPIAPGQTFTYFFNADLYGTSWYHAHYSAQYAGGVFGAMIIHGPVNAQYDVDLGPVLLTDYYHGSYYDLVEQVMGTDLNKVAPPSDNNLINGKGAFDCSVIGNSTNCTSGAGYSKFQFTKGQSYRLRLINAGAEAIQKFSIDNHQLKVIAYDFVPIVPYTTQIVTLGAGQRADVVVEATGASTDAVWMRSVISNCSLTNQPYGYAMVYHEKADVYSKPNTTAWPDTTPTGVDHCANDALSLTTPYFPISPPSTPATEVTVDLNFGLNATGHLVWTMNNSTFRTCYNDPVLVRAQENASNTNNGTLQFPTEWNVLDFGNASSIRIIVRNLSPVAHPMHMHGHNMYLLAEGMGEWDGTIVRPENPMRRDTQLLRPADASGNPGYMVLQIDADNPGVWPFHCHIAWHVSGGLYLNILERPNDILNIKTPSEVTDLCQTWGDYTRLGPIDQIDSGL
ncbi:oxidoreductase ptaK [Exophiala dermatitidis]